jgi:pyruvate dehydrogenase complex dehydrogenase (E1) component
VLASLAADGEISQDAVADAIARYGIDAEAPNPLFHPGYGLNR